MQDLYVKLPKVFTSKNARVAIDSLSVLYNESMKKEITNIYFDFSNCVEISPVGLLYIRMWKDELIDRQKLTFYNKSTDDNKMQQYLRFMSLLPKRSEEKLVSKEFFFYSIHSCNNINECSEAQREIISNVISRGKLKDSTYCSVDYMINELWDNAGVHGYACYQSPVYPKPVYMCALEYPDHYEISIGDRGQGIFSSLQQKRPYIKRKDALLECIKDGVSGHPDGSPGFGLFCSSEFIKKGHGNLTIWSSECHLDVSSSANKIYNSDFKIGTLVNIKFDKTAEMPFEKILCDNHNIIDYIDETIGGMFDE